MRAMVTALSVVAVCLGVAGDVGAEAIGLVHRGGRIDAPENTLATFAHTMSVGFQWMETDSWVSSDGVVVLHHDVDLCRTTNIEDFGYDCVNPANNPLGRKPWVKDFTLAELKALDAGSWFDPSFAGEQIPTLEEALQLVFGTPFVLVVEIKSLGQAALIDQILQGPNASADNLIVWTRQIQMTPEFRSTLPSVRRIVGGYDGTTVTDAELQDLAANGDFGIGILTNTIDASVVQRAHSFGLFVYGYPGATGNMPLMEQISIGVNGIHYASPSWWVNTIATLHCVDGSDNDGDGMADFDGVDFEWDGVLDLLPDPNCADRLETTELGQCQDGVDNDGDNLVDFGADPQCTAAWDDKEAAGRSCGLLGVEPLLVLLGAAARRRLRS